MRFRIQAEADQRRLASVLPKEKPAVMQPV
jgi:hypothetical protein